MRKLEQKNGLRFSETRVYRLEVRRGDFTARCPALCVGVIAPLVVKDHDPWGAMVRDLQNRVVQEVDFRASQSMPLPESDRLDIEESDGLFLVISINGWSDDKIVVMILDNITVILNKLLEQVRALRSLLHAFDALHMSKEDLELLAPVFDMLHAVSKQIDDIYRNRVSDKSFG